MKRTTIINTGISALCILLLGFLPVGVNAQDSKSPLVVNLSYYSSNSMPYLQVAAKTKVDGKFQPVGAVEIKLYLDKDASGKGVGFIGKVITNEKGKAGCDIPPALSSVWKASPNHIFIATTDKTQQFDETNTEISIAKGRITLDTAEDKNVVATFAEFKDGNWVPVKGVEMKLGIARLGGDLQIGDEQSYTTDSLGHVKGEFKKLGLPGNSKGNILLVAKVEDNDQYGNLRIEKAMPWGKPFVADADFFHKSALWASRFHSPLWLLVIAYSIVIAVWGTIIYLIFLLIKVKKLGKEEEALK